MEFHMQSPLLYKLSQQSDNGTSITMQQTIPHHNVFGKGINNVAWPFCQQTCGQTMMTTAVFSVRKMRYQGI